MPLSDSSRPLACDRPILTGVDDEAQREQRAADIGHDIARRLVEGANTKLRIPAGKFAVPADFVVHDDCRLERRNAGGIAEGRCRSEQSAQIQQVGQLDAARKRDTNGVIRIGLPDHAAVEAGFGQRAPVPIGIRQAKPGRDRAAATERKIVDPHGIGQRQVGLDVPVPHRAGGDHIIEHVRDRSGVSCAISSCRYSAEMRNVWSFPILKMSLRRATYNLLPRSKEGAAANGDTICWLFQLP